MPEPRDILGQERSERRPLPRWVKPAGIVLAALIAVAWVAASARQHVSDRTRGPATSTVSTADDPARRCGRPDRDGLAWATPRSTVQGNGELVIWQVHVCNRSERNVTVQALVPLSPAERILPAAEMNALRREAAIGYADVDRLPAVVPAHSESDVQVATVVVDCDQRSGPAGLAATVQVQGRRARRVNLPPVPAQSAPIQRWCGPVAADPQSTRFPLFRSGPVTTDVRGTTVDVRLPLLNPNDSPVILTGVRPPSPGVRVLTGPANVSIAPGASVAVSMSFAVLSCATVLVDAAWQPAFTGTMRGTDAQPAAVQVSPSAWQLPALQRICGQVEMLQAVSKFPELSVFPAVFRGGVETLRIVQVVRNSSPRALVLTEHARPGPGLEFVRVEVASGDQAQVGRVGGAPLTSWPMPPGSSATLTFYYRPLVGSDAVCELPPDALWAAPVDVIGAGGPAIAGDDQTNSARPAAGWRGGWLVATPGRCFAPIVRGQRPPFLLLAVGAPVRRDDRMVQTLTVHGLGLGAGATLAGARIVGPYADLTLDASAVRGEVGPRQDRRFGVTLPFTCPTDGFVVTVALFYRTDSAPSPVPALVDLDPPNDPNGTDAC